MVENCCLGEQFCWHFTLPDPAGALGRALRPDLPLEYLIFGIDKFPDMPCMKRVYKYK